MGKHNTKPKCKCGQTDLKKFNPSNMSTCAKCVNAKQNAKNYRNRKCSDPPKMSPEEQKEFGENATRQMRENLRIKRELLYG